ncbi:MAG: LPS export ABC transporter permease LptF [Sphingomonadaceae bacterium]
MFTATDRYLTRLIAVPLFACMVIAVVLFVLDKMQNLLRFVIEEGGPIDVMWRLLINLLPEYLSLGIPIGLLLGILLAFRKLALSSELDALRAVGLGYTRLLRAPYLFAIILAAINLGIVGYAQPYARYAYEGIDFELRSGALGASIKVGEFTSLGKRMTLRIEKSAEEGRRLTGIFAMGERGDGQSVAVTAKTGTFMSTDDPDVIILRLANGVLVHNAPNFRTPRILSFTSHDLPIDLPKIGSFRGRGGIDREMTIPELVRAGGNQKVPRPLRNQIRANFHFRLVEVAMMLLIPLLAVALAVPRKRTSSFLGVFLSIVMVVTYHKVNEYAESMGAQGRIDPLIALWVPFIIFAALILRLYYVLAYVPGGEPIGGLERLFAKVGAAIVRLFKASTPKTADI